MHNKLLLDWLTRCHQQTTWTASVCTGAFLLAAAGILDGLEVTTHWEDQQDLQQQFPSLKVCAGQRWGQQGKIITSAGISAGIDMSLHLLGCISDQALAIRTARQMEFDWQPA